MAVILKNHMHKFTIFTKSDKFHLTKNKIIYSILFVCLLLIFMINGPGIIKKNFFSNLIMSIFFITFFSGVILKFIGFTENEPLNGKLEGFLIFEKDSIQIYDEIFPLQKIKNIEITNDDYNGKLTGISRGNFNGALSNGVKNYVKLYLYSGELKMCNYELYNSDDFQKMKLELIHYYTKGKFSFDNLANLLGENSNDELKSLKSDIEKISTTANSQL